MSPRTRLDKTRQTFNLVVGWLGVALGFLLAVAMFTGGQGHAAAWFALAFAAASFCVMVRPFIAFTADEVVISNVVREVRLPWSGISHASSRGSLVVHDTEGGRTTVWAIGSQKARAERGTSQQPRSWRPAPGSLAELPTSSRALREALDAETIDNPDGVPSGRRVSWLGLPCALTAGAAVCVVLGLFS